MSEATTTLVTAEELLALSLFQGESRDAVEWLAAQMHVRAYEAGDRFATEGEPVAHFILILTGAIHFKLTRIDSTLIAPAGAAIGILPFSRLKIWGGSGWAAHPSRLAFMDASYLRELVYRAPVLAQHLVSEMTDRAREFTRLEEGSHRLQSLGKLSAGLAHELNNPAAAAVRSSARLRTVLGEKRRYALALHSLPISASSSELINRLADRVSECATTAGSMDTLERSDRESDLAEWLAARHVPGELAAGLVDAGIDATHLTALAGNLSTEAFELVLRSLAAEHELLCLSREMEEASRRISDLVHAVKVYSYMDRNPVSEVDVEPGIDATLRMFQHRLKQGIDLDWKPKGDLPKLRANGGALNQIWTNLIDNALDAMEAMPDEKPRRLAVRTGLEPGVLLIEVEDSGPGIPEDIQQRMFEPFFTTKGVGDGTGLGLDIVQRIVREHKGTIGVDSQPGQTTVQVRLPLAPL